MTDKEINEAIAELRGWKWCGFRHPDQDESFPRPGHDFKELSSDGTWSGTKRPDYCSDLNAMHEAWRDGLDEQKQWEFCDELDNVVAAACPESDIYRRDALATNATARQRAEAFLKTVGKWRD